MVIGCPYEIHGAKSIIIKQFAEIRETGNCLAKIASLLIRVQLLWANVQIIFQSKVSFDKKSNFLYDN